MHRDNTAPTHKNAIWRPIPTIQYHAIDHNCPSVWYVLKWVFGLVRHCGTRPGMIWNQDYIQFTSGGERVLIV